MSDDQREALLETGLMVFHRDGFGATGVRQVATAAGVPQGSFTNHFRSKDAFGLLVLERYADRLEAIMTATLDDEAKSPVERLSAYFDRIEASLAKAEWRQGCLIVDLAAEIPAHSEQIRRRLCEVLGAQTARFAAVCRSIDVGGNGSVDVGEFILAAWQGTLLRMKVERSADPIRRFRRTVDVLLRNCQAGDEIGQASLETSSGAAPRVRGTAWKAEGSLQSIATTSDVVKA